MSLKTSCGAGFGFFLYTFYLCWRHPYYVLKKYLYLFIKGYNSSEAYLFGHLWPVTFWDQDLWGSVCRTKCYKSFVSAVKFIHWDGWNCAQWIHRELYLALFKAGGQGWERTAGWHLEKYIFFSTMLVVFSYVSLVMPLIGVLVLIMGLVSCGKRGFLFFTFCSRI